MGWPLDHLFVENHTPKPYSGPPLLTPPTRYPQDSSGSSTGYTSMSWTCICFSARHWLFVFALDLIIFNIAQT